MLCIAECSYAISLKLAVRLSVRFRYRDHIGWKTLKIILWPNSLRPLLRLAPTWMIWCNENAPEIGLELVVGSLRMTKKPAVSPKWCEIGLQVTTTKSYTRFRLVSKSVTLDDLEWRIQGLLQVFTYTLLSQEQVKLRTSNSACTFTGSIRKKVIKNFGQKETWAYPGVAQSF